MATSLTPAQRAMIEALKSTEPTRGHHETSPTGEACRIVFVGRGETVFFQQGDRALLLEALPGRGVLFARSIRRWGDGKKVTDDEREVVIAIVSRVLEVLGADTVNVVRS